jgi:DNA-binding MarR family transcriptional regulator
MSPTARSAFPELVDEVIRLSVRISGATAHFGEDAGVSGAQLVVLTAVVRARQPPTVPQIARSLGRSRQGVQRLADLLVAAGMLVAVDNPDHKRAKRLVATPAGEAAYRGADERSARWETQLLAGFPPGDIEFAVSTLRRLRQRVEQHLAARPDLEPAV